MIIEKTIKFEVYPTDAPKLMTWNEATAWVELLEDGWRLPTKEELNLMYERRKEIGGFNESGSNPAGYYWSSTPYDINVAWGQRFSDGVQLYDGRNLRSSVRAVR